MPIETQASLRPAPVPAVSWPGRLHPAVWIAFAGSLSAITWIWVDMTQPPGEDALHLLNRSLVRVGLPFFIAAFCASSLALLRPNDVTRRLLRERRGIGLAWATVHLTHAAAILRLISIEQAPFVPDVGFAGGTIGFLFTIAMVATSNDASQRRMGQAWGRLHRYGIRYLMFIYVFSYVGRVASGPEVWPRIAMAILLAAIGLRVAAGIEARKNARASAEGVTAAEV
jgi:sulfoxide reductase heme-binding subunit YedZ